MNKIFVKRLKELRTNYNLSQKELADKIGVSKKQISNWEHGKSKPRFQNLYNISSIFHIRCNYLLGMDDIPKKNSIT